MKVLLKVGVAVALVAGFFFLFLRTARDVRGEAYVVDRASLAPWTVTLETTAGSTAPLVVARPPRALGSALFGQVFQRMMESLRGATDAGVPIVLRDEYELALASRFTPEALLAAATAAGVVSDAPSPACLAMRRVSQPGLTRTVYFVVFDAPAIAAFRHQLAREIAGTPTAALFDPEALSPVLIIGASDDRFDTWLPLQVDRATDCMAPIAVN